MDTEKKHHSPYFLSPKRKMVLCFIFTVFFLFSIMFIFLMTNYSDSSSTFYKQVRNIYKPKKDVWKLKNCQVLETSECQSSSCIKCSVMTISNGKATLPSSSMANHIIHAVENDRPKKFIFTAWSKAQNVDNIKDSKYSLHIKIRHFDGMVTEATGNFRTGTHDWEETNVSLMVRKLVSHIDVSFVFGGHLSGQVYFDNFELQMQDEYDDSLVEIQPRIILKNPSFENQRSSWKELGCEITKTDFHSGKHSCLMENDRNDIPRFTTQSVYFKKPDKERYLIKVAGYSKAVKVSGKPDINYALILGITYSDNTESMEFLPFSTETHDWELKSFIITPKHPVKAIHVTLTFKFKIGIVLFDDISIQFCKNQKCPDFPPKIWPFDEIFLLSEPHKVEERDEIINGLKRNGIDESYLSVIPVEPRSIKKHEIKSLMKWGLMKVPCQLFSAKNAAVDRNPSLLTNRLIASYFAFRSVATKVVDQDLEQVLLLTDGISVSRNLEFHFEKLVLGNPDEWNAIYLTKIDGVGLEIHSGLLSRMRIDSTIVEASKLFLEAPAALYKKAVFEAFLPRSLPVDLSMSSLDAVQLRYFVNYPEFILKKDKDQDHNTGYTAKDFKEFMSSC